MLLLQGNSVNIEFTDVQLNFPVEVMQGALPVEGLLRFAASFRASADLATHAYVVEGAAKAFNQTMLGAEAGAPPPPPPPPPPEATPAPAVAGGAAAAPGKPLLEFLVTIICPISRSNLRCILSAVTTRASASRLAT